MELLVDVEKFPSVNGMEIVLSISSLVYVDQQNCLHLLCFLPKFLPIILDLIFYII